MTARQRSCCGGKEKKGPKKMLHTAKLRKLPHKHRKGSLAILADGLDHDGAQGRTLYGQLNGVLRLSLQGSVQEQLSGTRVHVDDHFTGIGCIDIKASADGGI